MLGAELTFLAQLPIRVRRERLERQVLLAARRPYTPLHGMSSCPLAPLTTPTHPHTPSHPVCPLTHPQVLNQYGDRLDIEHLKDLCGPQMRTLQLGQPSNTHCTRAEFILAMLVRMQSPNPDPDPDPNFDPNPHPSSNS